MGLRDSIRRPKRDFSKLKNHKSKEHIEKSAKEFEKLEITPEAKEQFMKEEAMGYHIGNR